MSMITSVDIDPADIQVDDANCKSASSLLKCSAFWLCPSGSKKTSSRLCHHLHASARPFIISITSANGGCDLQFAFFLFRKPFRFFRNMVNHHRANPMYSALI
eukprot:Selendium_serpulae@DN8266_c0_g1_i1.p1